MINKKEIMDTLQNSTMNTLKMVLDFNNLIIDLKKIKRKNDFVTLLTDFLMEDEFRDKFIQKLNQDEKSTQLYHHLIWLNSTIYTDEAIKLYGIQLSGTQNNGNLKDNYAFIERIRYLHWTGTQDILKLDRDIISILRLFYPKPTNYELEEVKELEETTYNYTNENEILQFINIIEGMLKDNLVEFGKTNEKPLIKTINMIKTSSNINEFYTDKKLNTLATDMSLRTFYYYYLRVKYFKAKEHETLIDVFRYILTDNLDFFISRIFASHLKKIRFHQYCSEQQLFNIIKVIMLNLVSKGWVSMENILHFSDYRDFVFHLESEYKTEGYTLTTNDEDIDAEDYYNEIFLEPIIKAGMFYLGALGVLELKYNDPVSSCGITAKGLPYISAWDGLKYVRLTKLGNYILGVNKTYEAKEIEKQELPIKLDEYKPILTIDKSDILTLAKIEHFTDKLDTNRYILSYTKVFRDCKSYNQLVKKVESFYKIFDTKLPKVFDDYFNEIKENANMLKRDLKLITIELKNNKKLLNLFISNKRLQELIIKASGYRILVAKENISKVTKIIKDNGFFIEF